VTPTGKEAEAVPTLNAAPARLLLEQEAAAYLNVARGTLRNWRQEGKGPAFIRLGRLIRYSQEELLRYVRASTEHGGTAA